MGSIRLVATREFTERLRSRAFLISNAFIVVLLLGSLFLPVLLNGDGSDPVRVGTVGADAARVGEIALARQDNFELAIEVTELPDRDAAGAALADGDVEAVVLDTRTVLVESGIGPQLEGLLANAANALQVDDRLTEAGLDEEERRNLFAVEPLAVEVRDGGDRTDGPFSPQVMVAFIGVFLLYGLLVLYGQTVAQGIVEEKQSRVIEILLSTVRPIELLTGKILGLGLLGLAQMLLLVGIGVVGLLTTDSLELPSSGYGGLALVVAWYIPGFLLYATLFAMAGAVVSRVEDLQSAVMPVIFVLVLALIGAQAAIAEPTGTFATLAGLFPFTAPIVQPVLAASGATSALEMVLAAVLAVGALAVLLPVCARVYRGGILATRTRVSLRQAWGAPRPDVKAS